MPPSPSPYWMRGIATSFIFFLFVLSLCGGSLDGHGFVIISSMIMLQASFDKVQRADTLHSYLLGKWSLERLVKLEV